MSEARGSANPGGGDYIPDQEAVTHADRDGSETPDGTRAGVETAEGRTEARYAEAVEAVMALPDAEINDAADARGMENIGEVLAENERLRERVRIAEAEAEDAATFTNELAELMPPEFDGDEAQEYLIENWVRSLMTDRDAWKEVAEINDGSAKQAIARAEAAEAKVARVREACASRAQADQMFTYFEVDEVLALLDGTE